MRNEEKMNKKSRPRKQSPIAYDALAQDLRAAATSALRVRHRRGDDGPSNLDFVTLRLPRAVLTKVTAAGRAAGIGVYRRYSGAFRLFPPNPDEAQGYLRTARAKALARLLEARGWDVWVSYRLD